MRTALLAAALAVATLAQGAPVSSDPRARELIETLRMEYLEGESGYFAFLGQSGQLVTQEGRELPAQSRIYYLLTREHPTNFLHWLASDDTHILLEGGPVDYFIFHPDGRAERITLGRDLAAGQQLVIAIPGGCWKALQLHPEAGYALMANVLSPAWTPDRVTIGESEAFVGRFNAAAPWATADLIRQLIGPGLRP